MVQVGFGLAAIQSGADIQVSASGNILMDLGTEIQAGANFLIQ